MSGVVAVIDYGMGNLHSVASALEHVGADQVLVTHDLLGLFERFTPRFVKKYANFHGEMQRAFQAYKSEVLEGLFPTEEHSVEMPDQEWNAFLEVMEG